MNRRAYLTGVVVTSAVLALAACSSSSSGGSGSGSGSKTLVVQGNQYSIPVFEQVGKLFEQQNPGVKITYQTLNDQQESTTNLQVLTSSAAPDIADLPTNTTVYTEMIKNNQLLPLDDVWQADNLEAGYGEPLASSLKANGTPYVICYSRTLYGVVWYNKSIFSKLGIDVPADHQIASMDNLQKITDTLRSGGYQPLAVGGASDYQLTWILDSLLPTSASPTQLTNYTTNYQASVPVTAQYTDPAFTAVLERLKQMYDDKVFQDGVLGMDQTADLALFAAGKAGMVMGHNLTPTGLSTSNKVNLDLGYLFLPPVNAGQKTLPVNYAGNTVAIPKDAKNPDLAKKYLEFLMTAANQSKSIAWSQGAAPGINLSAADLKTGAPPIELDLLAYAQQNGTAAGWASIVPASLGTADPYIEKLFTGSTTAQAIGTALNGERDKIRAGS